MELNDAHAATALLVGSHPGPGHGVEDRADHRARVDTLGDRVERQHQPVGQHVGGEIGDVTRQHVVPAPQQRQGSGGGDQS